MSSRRRTSIAVLLGLLVQLIAAQTSTWGVSNRQITKDGEVFMIKGVNYAPMPPGAGVGEATQWGDLFHSQWAHLHDRDIPLMREAGVNSIRIYQLQLKDPTSQVVLDHTSFFDKLYNNGDNPIYILITYAISTPFTYLGPFDTQPATGDSFQTSDGKWYQVDQTKETDNALKREIESNIVAEIAKNYGTHPAVMGFVIGNEQNNAVTRSNCQFWQWIDSIAQRVKLAAPGKLTATTIVDDNFVTVKAAMACNALADLDVWGINAYRGRVDVGFDDLFKDFAANTNQALLITEFGCPSSTRDASNNYIMMPENSKSQGDYLKVHWDDIVTHKEICSGGYAFSWADEWWKLGNPISQDQDDARNGAFPGTYADEESYGLIALDVDCDKINDWATRVDQALPRAVYFIMGQMFGAWTEVPAQAYQPINYPRCNGQWVGGPNTPNAVTPVDPQQPVSAIPTTQTPSGNTESPTSDPQEPTSVTTPIDSNTPSIIAAPIDGTSNQNTNSASGIACSTALIVLSVITLIF